MTSASSQIASSAEELSQSSTEQAASVEEMNSMIGKNTENANTTASLEKESTQASARGQTVVAKMIEAMEHIDKSNSTIMVQVNASNQLSLIRGCPAILLGQSAQIYQHNLGPNDHP